MRKRPKSREETPTRGITQNETIGLASWFESGIALHKFQGVRAKCDNLSVLSLKGRQQIIKIYK